MTISSILFLKQTNNSIKKNSYTSFLQQTACLPHVLHLNLMFIETLHFTPHYANHQQLKGTRGREQSVHLDEQFIITSLHGVAEVDRYSQT